MYRVTIKDKAYSSMSFIFGDMEEAAVFIETALKASEMGIEASIELDKEEETDGERSE